MSLSKRIWFGLLFLAFLGSAAENVSACSCVLPPTVDIEFEQHAFVGVFRVVSIENPTREEYEKGEKEFRVHLIAERVFKGDLQEGDEVILGQGAGTDCNSAFNQDTIGKSFLLYLGRDRGMGTVVKKPELGFVSTCSRSGTISMNMKWADRAFLDKWKSVQGKTRISGVLLQYDEARTPFPNHKITLIGNGKVTELRTDDKGVFEVYGLSPGKYVLMPDLIEGFKLSYGGPKVELKIKQGQHSEQIFLFLEK